MFRERMTSAICSEIARRSKGEGESKTESAFCLVFRKCRKRSYCSLRASSAEALALDSEDRIKFFSQFFTADLSLIFLLHCPPTIRE
jgi:hypothetical protein